MARAQRKKLKLQEDNGMLGYMMEALKSKVDEFEGQGEHLKLVTMFTIIEEQLRNQLRAFYIVWLGFEQYAHPLTFFQTNSSQGSIDSSNLLTIQPRETTQASKTINRERVSREKEREIEKGLPVTLVTAETDSEGAISDLLVAYSRRLDVVVSLLSDCSSSRFLLQVVSKPWFGSSTPATGQQSFGSERTFSKRKPKPGLNTPEEYPESWNGEVLKEKLGDAHSCLTLHLTDNVL
ncbi:hypothetical protein M9H77_08455 [Catharanthus roseus]|uniref:Uncharacterized protein n=1 Tax=Catharanthus roseus TaxID=4058 RepID=A0ACC0BXZ5_CATRO|nr:hypothetical protein M9H77_08455 [Catharanthus roseus]